MSRPDWILKGKEFHIARNAVPLVDVEEIRKRAGEEIKQHNDDILRAMLVKLRWTNPICDGCQKKDPDTIRLLKRCGRCYLSAYCSKTCQRKHWSVHKLRCGQLDGPPDEGPQRLGFVELCRKCKTKSTMQNGPLCKECGEKYILFNMQQYEAQGGTWEDTEDTEELLPDAPFTVEQWCHLSE